MSDIRDYQVDHLLLLVGSNPVPNAVAGKLLTVPGGTITLIHSHATGSFDLAQRLASWFDKSGIHADFKEVQESDAYSVVRGVQQILQRYANDSGSIHHTIRPGLNYTGGTKVMAVHAYRALEQWAKDHSRLSNPVFSYLDATTLQMHIVGNPPASFYVGRDIKISIDELLGLHNWEPIYAPVTVPALPESAKALLALHSKLADAGKWVTWLNDEFFPKARKRVPLDPPFWVFQSGEELPGQYEVQYPARNDKWQRKTNLRALTLSWPDLPDLRETISNELELGEAERLSLTAAVGRGCKDEVDFCKWLSGVWMEVAVLSALQNCPPQLHLDECCMDIRPKALGSSARRELFQFDVAAIRGYQLFAFSCSTEDGSESGGRWLLKQKLFEVYVRARQMGGDEACAALVCCTTQETADELEAEMRRDISPQGRIRVFSRECLADLSRHIANWVHQQSGVHEHSKEG